MVSQKSRRRMSSPPPASNAAGRLSLMAEAAPTVQRVGGRTPHGCARSPACSGSRARCSGPSVGFWGPAGREENFPPCKPLQTNETELESRQILIRSEEADATAAAVSPGQRSRSNPASILGVVRGKSAAPRMRAAKFSYPQTLENAGNGEGISPLSLLAPTRAGVQENAASRSRGIDECRCELSITDTELAHLGV
jgi:hypothetical protein